MTAVQAMIRGLVSHIPTPFWGQSHAPADRPHKHMVGKFRAEYDSEPARGQTVNPALEDLFRNSTVVSAKRGL
jgi:hypothetical protein